MQGKSEGKSREGRKQGQGKGRLWKKNEHRPKKRTRKSLNCLNYQNEKKTYHWSKGGLLVKL